MARASRDDEPAAGEREAHPGAPRWVKVVVAVVVVLVVLAVVSQLLGVEHGPGLHGGSLGAA